jgi:putative tryptophan/tyrosine transport system substrate-binding protein
MCPVRRLGSILLLSLALGGWRPAHAVDVVPLVLSEPGGAYAEVAAKIRESLRGSVEISELVPGDAKVMARGAPRIAVAIGTLACRAVAESSTTMPLVCALVPRSAYEKIAAGVRGRGVTAVLLDQPVSRQMALIRLTARDYREVAVLLGGESASLARALTQGAAEHGLRLATTRVESIEDLPGALQSALDNADVLLAVPDSSIYNARTLQNILRAGFQTKVPLFAFSPAYVRAGALAAVYSTPAQVGAQAAAWIARYLEGRPLPAAQAPREFEVSVNRNVARALGLTVDDDQTLADRLRKMEAAR